MKKITIQKVLYSIILLLLISIISLGQNAKHNAEDLWSSIDFITLKKNIQLKTGISNQEIDLYMKFLDHTFPEIRSDFFNRVEREQINTQNLQNFLDELTEKYISAYSDYLNNKQKFTDLQNATIYKPLSFNGPCENINFESGTTDGWQGSIGAACQNATPCSVVNGFSTTRHEIMNTTMVDPYIPSLPVVAPGGNYSLRLENYVNGGNAAMIRQTFLVTPTNNIFTYQYAAVLEDPGDHGDAERPYFKVRMYDKNGNEINCATYTAIAKPPIQNFTYNKTPNPNFNNSRPPSNNNIQFLDLYYRNWTTITIPLLTYVGQNVTVEFIASDCSRGGHLGYAYIDASCSFLDTQIPPTICGTENVTLLGPSNFAKYQWTGPGIVGSATTQNILVNKSGIYKLKLTPVADNPCPVNVQTTVPEKCLPVPISAKACETVKGSKIKIGVNLTTYNTLITEYNALARVFAWHSGLPATIANKISDPTNINVRNGNKYYAVINYTSAGSDTAELNFVINSLPNLVFADINPICKSNTPITISGASPIGGVFSGKNITAQGLFSPITVGTFPITYTYTSSNGCIDSIVKSVTINPPPTISLPPNQKLCATTSTVSLIANSSNQTNIKWSGGLGTFLNDQNATTEYTPTLAEKNAGSINLILTATGIAPCAPISSNTTITFTPSPTVNAGIDRDICIPSNLIIQLQGSSTNAQKNTWSGGSELFSNVNALNSIYQPTQKDIEAGSVVLTLTTEGKIPCAQVQDEIEIRFHDSPVANAGPNKTVCNNSAVLLSTTSSPGINYEWVSLYGTPVSLTESVSIIADKDSSFILKLKNTHGCIDSDTVKIISFTPPILNLNGPYCYTDQLILNSNPSISDPLLEKPIWTKDGIIINGANNFSITTQQEGNYTITYKQGECETSSSTTIYKNPILITPDEVIDCEQNIITLNTSNILQASYSWLKNGAPISGNTNSISIPVTNLLDKYTVEVVDQNNCKAKDSIKVIGVPRPVIQLENMSVCEGTIAQIDGTPVNINSLANYQITYKWFYNNTEIIKNTSNTNAISKGGNYTLIAAVNSCPATSSMNLIVNPLPILNLPELKKICPEANTPVILDAGNHTSFIWTPTGETSQQISVNSGGVYMVTVFNNNNCSKSGKVEVKEVCPPRLFVADAFSPNQDGTNDLFKTYGAHIGKYQLLIFNRWGEIIYESNDEDSFWNGIYKGESMPIGVYPWIITYEGDSEEYIGPYKLEGSVTLVK